MTAFRKVSGRDMAPPRLPARRSRSRAVFAAVVLWLAAGQGCAAAPAPTVAAEHGVDIQLDVRPFTEPEAVHVSLDREGVMTVLRYRPARLVVTGSTQRTASAEERAGVRMRIDAPGFREAMRRVRVAGTGLSRGDQFRLALGARDAAPGLMQGFVDDAPPPVRALIDDLLRLARSGPADSAALAPAYVVGEPVEADREAGLRAAGKVRFVKTAEVAPPLGAVLNRVTEAPYAFHPVTRDQHRELLVHRSYGAEVFLARDGGRPAFQLVLYLAP